MEGVDGVKKDTFIIHGGVCFLVFPFSRSSLRNASTLLEGKEEKRNKGRINRRTRMG